MEYFKIEQDKRIPYAVLLTGLDKIGGYYASKKGNLSALDNVIVSFVHSSPVNIYPDILDRQIFMIKGAVKEVFDLFLPELDYKHCCLLDRTNETYEQYFIPLLEFADASEDTLTNRHIFRLKETTDMDVIASLEVAEAILRRRPEGVRIRQWKPPIQRTQ